MVGENYLEPLKEFRLIPINRNPGLRSICVAEGLGQIIEKIVMKIALTDVTSTASSLQLCAEQEGGIETMPKIYDENKTKVRMNFSTLFTL